VETSIYRIDSGGTIPEITTEQQLKNVLGYHAENTYLGIIGEEGLSVATETILDMLLKHALKDPELGKTLLTPLGKLKGYEYLISDSFVIQINGRVITEKTVTLGIIMKATIEDKLWNSYFITDDKTDSLIGFIAYIIDENDSKIVSNVKLFKFVKSASTEADAPTLIYDLLIKFKEVRWSAKIANRASTFGYDPFVRNLERNGCITSRTESGDMVYYTVKSKTVH
jgi:hypothetical protein